MKTRTKMSLLLAMIPAVLTAQPYGGDATLRGPVGGEPVRGTLSCGAPANPFADCGFEAADLSNWVVADAASPLLPLQVAAGGSSVGYGFFATAPTEGVQTLVHGFDQVSGGADTIVIGQDISISAGSGATLTFDYRGAWDLMSFGATLDRNFEVHIEPSGGGAPMQVDSVLTATAGTIVTDTGALSGAVDVSAFVGQSVRANFVWDVPEGFVGPGFFQLDNVAVVVEENTLAIPTLGPVAIGVLVGLLGLAGLVMVRRLF